MGVGDGAGVMVGKGVGVGRGGSEVAVGSGERAGEGSGEAAGAAGEEQAVTMRTAMETIAAMRRVRRRRTFTRHLSYGLAVFAARCSVCDMR